MKRVADILRIDRFCAYVVWALYAAPTIMIVVWAAKMRSSRSAVAVVITFVLAAYVTAIVTRTWRRFFLAQFPVCLLGVAFVAYTVTFGIPPGSAGVHFGVYVAGRAAGIFRPAAGTVVGLAARSMVRVLPGVGVDGADRTYFLRPPSFPVSHDLGSRGAARCLCGEQSVSADRRRGAGARRGELDVLWGRHSARESRDASFLNEQDPLPGASYGGRGGACFGRRRVRAARLVVRLWLWPPDDPVFELDQR